MTEKLVALEDVARLSKNIVRILGGNPGKFTLQGTNTYLLTPPSAAESGSLSGSSTPCILVDTAEGKESYAPLLKKVLDGQDARVGQSRHDVSDIVLTHRHHDHVGGLPSVLSMLAERRRTQQMGEAPRIHKFPDRETDEELYAQLKDLPADAFTATASGLPIWPLADGDELSFAAVDKQDRDPPALRVVHSPGHTKDHICLFLHSECALLTGDHVLGQGTSVFEDLGSYLSSLRKCISVLNQASVSSTEGTAGPILYPAHGPIIEKGQSALEGYLTHRLERENQVLTLLSKQRDDDHPNAVPQWTIPELVSELYRDYPETLYPAAARGLFLHLHKLGRPDGEAIERGAVDASDTNQGRRVYCRGEMGSGAPELAPDIPTNEAEWMHVMELKWSRLDHAAAPDHPLSTSQNFKNGAL